MGTEKRKGGKFEDVLLVILVVMLLLGMVLTVKFGTTRSLHSYIQEKPANTSQ